MKMQVYVVYDAKAGFYNTPFFMRSNGEAVRGFEELANDKETQIGRHPEDFVLYRIGEYDNQTSALIIIDTPECLGKAIEYKKVDKQYELKELGEMGHIPERRCE